MVFFPPSTIVLCIRNDGSVLPSQEERTIPNQQTGYIFPLSQYPVRPTNCQFHFWQATNHQGSGTRRGWLEFKVWHLSDVHGPQKRTLLWLRFLLIGWKKMANEKTGQLITMLFFCGPWWCTQGAWRIKVLVWGFQDFWLLFPLILIKMNLWIPKRKKSTDRHTFL